MRPVTSKYLTILYYIDGRLYQTDLTKHFNEQELQDGVNIEDFLEEQGYDSGNCHYMTHEYPNIETL